MNKEFRLRVKVIFVLILVVSLVCSVRFVSNANPNEYNETETTPDAGVEYTNSNSDEVNQLYKALVNRETSMTIYTNNSSDIVDRIYNEELFDEVEKIDDPNTSDDADYIYYNIESYETADYGDSVVLTVNWREDRAMLDKVNGRVKEILQETGVYNMNNAYDIAKTLHDYIVNNVEYDNSLTKFTTYEALFEQSAVCQGYSLLYYKLLSEAGVQCKLITGTADGGDHAWNLVKVGGAWYNVDTTWDDPEGGSLRHKYFLTGSSNFNADHSRDDKYNTDSFHSAYPTSSSDFSQDGYTGNDVNVPSSNNASTNNNDSNQAPEVTQEVPQSDNGQNSEVNQSNEYNDPQSGNSYSEENTINSSEGSSSSSSVSSRIEINGQVIEEQSYESNNGNSSVGVNVSTNMDNLEESIEAYANEIMNSVFGNQ